jgi:hypothetical protein
MGTFRSHRQTPRFQTPDIIVYPNRRIITIWLILSVVSSLFFFLLFVFVCILMIVTPVSRNAGAIFTTILMFGFGAMGLWLTRALASLLSSGKPMLVINHRGICVGTKTYGSIEFILPWEEIEAIYMLSSMLNKQLYIRPTNIELFLSRFSPIMRFFLRTNLTPIAVAQFYLEKPIEEILDQLQTQYVRELDHYHIQLRP